MLNAQVHLTGFVHPKLTFCTFGVQTVVFVYTQVQTVVFAYTEA